MLHWNARKHDLGFTLIEMLVTSVVVSVVAAIASPNLIGMLNRYRLEEGIKQIEGAIKETQRQAIRRGRVCQIDIDTNTNNLTGTTDCLLESRKLDDDIVIRTNLTGTPPNISFSYKGSTTKSGTIVVSSDNIVQQKCFVISLGIGIMRTGDYTGSQTGSVSAADCQSND